MHRTNPLVWVVVLVASLLPLVGVWYGQFTHGSYCAGCGAGLFGTRYQVPFTRLTLHDTATVHPTPLSTTLADLGRIPADHEHDWSFAGGRGNGVGCAIGFGGAIGRFARSDAGVAFLRRLHEEGRDEALGTWLPRLLNPRRAREYLRVLQMHGPAPLDDLFARLEEERELLDEAGVRAASPSGR